jgi:hypothetical protein
MEAIRVVVERPWDQQRSRWFVERVRLASVRGIAVWRPVESEWCKSREAALERASSWAAILAVDVVFESHPGNVERFEVML